MVTSLLLHQHLGVQPPTTVTLATTLLETHPARVLLMVIGLEVHQHVRVSGKDSKLHATIYSAHAVHTIHVHTMLQYK